MKIFKRTNQPAAPFYVRFEVKGRAYKWSTRTNDLKVAKTRAKGYYDAIVAERFQLADAMKARGMTPVTFDQVMADYMTFPAPAYRTRKDNCAALALVLDASRLNGGSTIDRIGADLATNWQKQAMATGRPPTTANTVLRAARSLFSRHAMLRYKSTLRPDSEKVRALFSVPCLKEPQKRPELPTIEADQRAHAELPNHPECYRAWLLARYCGCRAGEIIAAQKSWIEGETLFIGGRDFTAKSKRWRSVAIPPGILPLLLSSPHDSLVGEFPKQVVRRTLPALLHSFGFPKMKPLHSLRRLSGSQAYTLYGPRQARIFLGHASQATTDKFYAVSLDQPKPLPYHAAGGF